jgi:hypothetical protein
MTFGVGLAVEAPRVNAAGQDIEMLVCKVDVGEEIHGTAPA